MSLGRTLSRNVFFNWTDYSFRIIVGFFLTPFILHSLGDVRFGFWTLITGVVGYYGFINFGFNASLRQYITRFAASQQDEELNRFVSTAWFILAGCCLLLLLATPLVAWLVPRFFTISEAAVTEVRWCILIVGTTSALSFLFFPFTAVLPAMQRFDLSGIIGSVGRFIFAGAVVVALSVGGGLVGVSLAVAFHAAVDYSVRSLAALRILPNLRISYRLLSRKSLRELWSFGLWNTVSQWSDTGVKSTTPVIIGGFMSPAAITPFALASQLNGHLASLFVCVSTTFFPVMTHLDAENDQAGLRRVYLRGTRVVTSLATAACLAALFLADDFFHLWIGAEFADGTTYCSPTLLFSVLLVGVYVRISRSVGIQFLLGTRRVDLLAKMGVGGAIATVVAVFLFIHHFGLLGVALALVVPECILSLVVQPMLVNRSLQVGWREFFLKAWMRPLLIAPGLICLGNSVWIPHSDASWLAFVARAGILGAGGFALFMAIGLTSSEIRNLLASPLARMGWARSVS